MYDKFCKFTQLWHDLCYVLKLLFFFWHVAHMGERRMAHSVLVGKSERKRSLGRIVGG